MRGPSGARSPVPAAPRVSGPGQRRPAEPLPPGPRQWTRVPRETGPGPPWSGCQDLRENGGAQADPLGSSHAGPAAARPWAPLGRVAPGGVGCSAPRRSEGLGTWVGGEGCQVRKGQGRRRPRESRWGRGGDRSGAGPRDSGAQDRRDLTEVGHQRQSGKAPGRDGAAWPLWLPWRFGVSRMNGSLVEGSGPPSGEQIGGSRSCLASQGK